MKVIFLDIDGVLNTDATYKRWWAQHGDPLGKPLDDLHGLLEPALCQRIADTARKAEATIVVSSSWRRLFDATELIDFLGEHGIVAAGVTPTLVSRRGEAAVAWLAANGIDRGDCVMVDDASCRPLNDRRVLTNPRYGYTWACARTTLRMLKATS